MPTARSLTSEHSGDRRAAYSDGAGTLSRLNESYDALSNRLRGLYGPLKNDAADSVGEREVTEAVEYDCDVIVIGNLTDIRERLPHATWHQIWAFRRLYAYVEYKAPERGVSVEQVVPDHTSQRCSRTDCGFTHEANRDGDNFCCQKCGYKVNADHNTAKNIGLRYAWRRQYRLRSSPTSGDEDAPVDMHIPGGTVNGTSHRPLAGD